MATTLRIHFSGLIGFVPSTKRQAMRVLVIDARHRHRGPLGEELFPHLGFLRFRMSDLDAASQRYPDVTAKNYGFSLLQGEELVVSGLSAGKAAARNTTKETSSLAFQLSRSKSSTQLALGPGSLSHTLNQVQKSGKSPQPGADDLCWVMPIDRILTPPTPTPIVHPRYLAQDYRVLDADPARLLARLRLNSGTLRVRDFRRTSIEGEILNTRVRFRPAGANGKPLEGKPPNWEAPLATKVVWQIEVPSESITICSSRFPRNSKKAPLNGPDLVLRPAAPGSAIELDLWNAPLQNLLDLIKDERDIAEFEGPTGDRSLRSYFCLCEKLPSKKQLPYVEVEKEQALSLQMDVTAAKSVGCPMSIFPAHEDA